MVTNTEIHFLPVDESHTCALSRDTKHLRLDGQVCFYRQLFSERCQTKTVHFMACVAINKIAWDAKLILTADLAYPVNCASLSHLQMAQVALPFVFKCLPFA